MSDLIYTEPKYTECADTAVVTRGSADDPWGGWERWLDGHLAIERHAIVVGQRTGVINQFGPLRNVFTQPRPIGDGGIGLDRLHTHSVDLLS